MKAMSAKINGEGLLVMGWQTCRCSWLNITFGYIYPSHESWDSSLQNKWWADIYT